MKTIVTHLSPDLDAISAVWLIKRFLPGWKNARLSFIPAGSTYENKPVDRDPEIMHVDTGLGKFDHHQTPAYTSATRLVFEYLLKEELVEAKSEKALERMVTYINSIDHFGEVYFPDPLSDRYEFGLHQISESLKSIVSSDHELCVYLSPILDALVIQFSRRILAEEELKKGYVFRSRWGKSIAIETFNSETSKVAQKSGYILVITREPKKGHMRIRTLPEKKYDLSVMYKKIKVKDQRGTWFLHASKTLLLNASSKNPNFIPTSLSLKDVIEIAQSI